MTLIVLTIVNLLLLTVVFAASPLLCFTRHHPLPFPPGLSVGGPLYRLLTLHPSHPIRLLLVIFLIPCLVTLLGLRPVSSVWNACLVRCRSHLQ